MLTQNLMAFKSYCETLAFICEVRITISGPICDVQSQGCYESTLGSHENKAVVVKGIP